MVEFMALVTNSYGWSKFFHTVLSGYVVAAFFVMGISAWHILRKTNLSFFKISFKIAAIFGLLSSLLVFLTGDHHAVEVAKSQPTKFAAMEVVWETQKAVPYNLIVVPDIQNEKNSVEALGIPKMMSFMAFRDSEAEIKGLKDFAKELRPPIMPTFLSFKAMAALGMLFMLVAALAWLFSYRDRLESVPYFLKLMIYVIPLPYIACQAGWVVAEMGRQPWIVYGLLKTSDAVSKSVSVDQVIISLAGFTILYGFLAIVDIYLLFKYARQGPDDTASGATPNSASVAGTKEA
jgi:cytochrome d ubiquinol oxidase subunit I